MMGDGHSSDEEEDASHQSEEDPSSPSRKRKAPGDEASSYEQKWNDMFERLKAFKEKHGHCRVPNRYADDPQLGNWVSTQRRQYRILTTGGNRSVPLTLERARQLIDLGFEWSAKDPTHKTWKERFEELKSFQDKYGHTCVPMGWQENPRLATWMSTQRQEYKLLKQGHSSRLNEAKVRELDRIDFTWEAPRGRRRLQDMPESSSPLETETATQSAALPSTSSGVVSGTQASTHFNPLRGSPLQEQNISALQQAAVTNPLQGILSSAPSSHEQLQQLLQQAQGFERSGIQEQKMNSGFSGPNRQAQALSFMQSIQLQSRRPNNGPGGIQPASSARGEASPSIHDQLLGLMQTREFQNLTRESSIQPPRVASLDVSGIAAFRTSSGNDFSRLLQTLRSDSSAESRPLSQLESLSLLLQGRQENQMQRQSFGQQGGGGGGAAAFSGTSQNSSLDEALALRLAQGLISSASTQELQSLANAYSVMRGGGEARSSSQSSNQDLRRLLDNRSSSLATQNSALDRGSQDRLQTLLGRLSEIQAPAQSQRISIMDSMNQRQQQQQQQQAAGINLSQWLPSATIPNQPGQQQYTTTASSSNIDMSRLRTEASLESMLRSQAGKGHQQGQQAHQSLQDSEGGKNSDDSDDKKPAASGPASKKRRQG